MNTEKHLHVRAGRSLFRFMRPHRTPFLFGIVMYSGQSFVTALLGSMQLSQMTEAMLSGSVPGIYTALLRYVACLLVYFTVLAFGVYQYVVSGERATRDLKRSLFRGFTRASVENRGHSGEGIAAMNTEADLAAGLFNNPLSAILTCLISVVFSAAVIFAVDWRLGLVCVGVGLVAFFPQYGFAGPLGRLQETRLALNAATVRTVSALFSGGASIRAFGLGGKMEADFDRDNSGLFKLYLKEAVISLWQYAFTTVEGWLSLAGVYGLGGYLVATGRLSFASLMMVPGMCVALSLGMSQIGSAWAGLQGPLAAARRIDRLLPSAETPDTQAGGQGGGDWDGEYTLRISDLHFRYPDAETNALTGVSLVIGQNETVALVGRSGSGKSTLLRAVIGLYERDDLTMALGNLSFGDLPAAQWRKHFAYVDQSCKLFDMSIADNIRLGRTDATPEEIRQAAAEAGADGFISALPDGYDTACGEGGAFLSGGQKQRIAIARALVRRAPVLVFDEATSALDAESERLIMDTIRRLGKNHTILMTSHNLREVIEADRIVVMDSGRIVETGTHGELTARGGEYALLQAGRETL